MSTLSFWLMLLIERRVGLTAWHVPHSLLMLVMSAWLYIVECWPELRRDNDCMVLGPDNAHRETILWLTLTWNWLEINTAWQWLMPRRLSPLCRVYVVISCQVSQIYCTGPHPGAAVSAGDVRLGIHSAVVSTLVSDGVSQRVTGRGAASSDILSDLCSLRWLTHRPRQPREHHLNSCHPTLKSDTLRHDQQWPPVPRDCPWLKMGRRKQIVPKKSDNLDDQDPSKTAKNDEG